MALVIATIALTVVALVMGSALAARIIHQEREDMRERAEQYRQEIEWMRRNGTLPADWQE